MNRRVQAQIEVSSIHEDQARTRLSAAQEKLGMNQAVFARELGITPEWLSKIYNGRAMVSKNVDLRAEALLRSHQIEPGSSPRDEASSSTLEEAAPAGGPQSSGSAVLGAQIRAEFDALLAAAGDNRDRLGWIRVQLDQMRGVARAWLSAEEANGLANARAVQKMQEIRAERLRADDARRRRETA